MNGRAPGTGEQDVRLRKEGGDERTEEFQRAGSQKSRRQRPGAEKQRSAALNVQRQAPRREQEGRKQETESIKTTASNLPEAKCRPGQAFQKTRVDFQSGFWAAGPGEGQISSNEFFSFSLKKVA